MYLKKLQYSTKSAIALIVAITMLTSTKNASSFTAKLQIIVKSFPNTRATYTHRFTDRITSQGIVRYRSDRVQRKNSATNTDVDGVQPPPVLVVEGLFAVDKPLEWTSQDVVSFIRGMFERDARSRGVTPGKIGSRKNRGLPVIRVGHGGTLDPLATGVLVIGLGSGTKLLQG